MVCELYLNEAVTKKKKKKEKSIGGMQNEWVNEGGGILL